MILVPAGTKGVKILRAMKVYGDDDAPHGHMHLKFENVRVPKDNLILGEGRGFEIAQGRLGPGRIHHCMRAIGQAEMALELMCRRSLSREAFGEKLAKLGANFDIIAECRMEIEMARLLCLKAAWMMDKAARARRALDLPDQGGRAARCAQVTDEAVQMYGAQGISQDTPLAQCGRICGRCGWPMARTPCTAGRSRGPSSSAIRTRRFEGSGTRVLAAGSLPSAPRIGGGFRQG